MSSKKKSTYVQGPIISVAKHRWAYYNGKKMSYGYLMTLGISREDLEVNKRQLKLTVTPSGVYGAPVTDDDSVTEFLVKLGLKRKLITFKTRYHVTDHDVVTADKTPTPPNIVYDYSKTQRGFKNRMLANLEAETRYEWFCKMCMDGSKPTQPVQLILLDRDGNIAKKKNNGWKPKAKNT